MRTLLSSAALCATLPSLALAEAPRVVTDIPPVHALVAQVMQGVGEPDLLLPPGGSPHGHQMRPSEAHTLANGHLLFWIGAAQSPWIEEATKTLATNIRSVPLIEVEGTHLRLGGHDHGEEGHDDHGDDHADHAEHDDHDDNHAAHEDHDHEAKHDDDHDHEDHAEDHQDHDHEDHTGDDHDHSDGHHVGDGHVHDGIDHHAWLDPVNALIWLPEISRQLSEIDPANAATYRENTEAAMTRIKTLTGELTARLSPLEGGFFVYHDAYGYFTDRFDLPASGAIAESDATPPGARRIAELQAEAETADIRCLFTEPQFDTRTADRMAATLGVQVHTLDPVGSSMTPGPDLYDDLLLNLAKGLEACLTPE